jgi:hypothetical protein
MGSRSRHARIAVARLHAPDDARDHLTRLATVLQRSGFEAALEQSRDAVWLRVTNPEASVLTERIHCRRHPDQTWHYRWPWGEPIKPVAHLGQAAQVIMGVLRAEP